jgi:hypothetical protein
MQDEIDGTIQLDKLTLCCISTVKNNFNHETLINSKDGVRYTYNFGYTTLSKADDESRRYKYCYNVTHADIRIGKIKFGMYGRSDLDDKVWFSIYIKVFYNKILQFLPAIFENLNLNLHHVTRMDIALDNYFVEFGAFIRKHLRNKENKVKLFGKYIKDRKKLEKGIQYWNCGSLDNPFKIRTLYIKNKKQVNYPKGKKQDEEEEKSEGKSKGTKTTIEFTAYNKQEEIDNFSPHKKYILDYHKEHNPNYKHIYREEIRLESEELRRLKEKREKKGKSITLTDLLSKEFLYEVFTEYIDRIIIIKDSKNQKIDLFPKPFLGYCGGKLPLTLPPEPSNPQPVKNKDIPLVENEIQEFYQQEDFEEIIYNNPIYFEYYENNEKIVRSHETQNKQLSKRNQKPKFRQTTIPRTSKQYQGCNAAILETN